MPIQKICLGQIPELCVAAQISGSCPGPWKWTLKISDNTYSSGQSESPNFCVPETDIFVPPNPGVYDYKLDVQRGNHNTLTVKFIVYVYPVLNAQVLVGYDPPGSNGIVTTELCRNNTATLNMVGASGCQVLWHYRIEGTTTWHPMPGGGSGNPYNTNPLSAFLPDENLNVHFRGTASCPNLPLPWPSDTCPDDPSCCPNVRVVNLHVWGTPQTGNITASPNPLCQPPDSSPPPYMPIQLDINPPDEAPMVVDPVDPFAWSCPQGGTFSDSHIQNPTFVVNQAGSYDITVLIKNGLCHITKSISVVVVDPITANITITSGTNELCWGRNAQLLLFHNGPPGSTITWEYQINCTGQWTSTGISGTIQNTSVLFGQIQSGQIPGVNQADVNTICWRAIVTPPVCPPTITDPVTIFNVIQPPGVPTITALGSVVKCFGTPVTLIASTPGNGPFTYEWFHDGLHVDSDAVPSDGSSIHAILPGNYYVRVRNTCGAEKQSEGVVTLRDCILTVTVKDSCTCSNTNENIDLTAIPHCAVNPLGPVGGCHGPYQYHWYGTLLEEDQFTQHIQITCPDHTMQPGELGLDVTNQLGCTTHVDILIKRCL